MSVTFQDDRGLTWEWMTRSEVAEVFAAHDRAVRSYPACRQAWPTVEQALTVGLAHTFAYAEEDEGGVIVPALMLQAYRRALAVHQEPDPDPAVYGPAHVEQLCRYWTERILGHLRALEAARQDAVRAWGVPADPEQPERLADTTVGAGSGEALFGELTPQQKAGGGGAGAGGGLPTGAKVALGVGVTLGLWGFLWVVGGKVFGR